MDQTPAQPSDVNSVIPPEGIVSQEIPPSPFKKLIPFIAVAVILLLILIFLMVLSGGKKTASNNVIPAPTIRPTATPIAAPTIPLVTQTAISSTSASIAPAKTGRLAFIRDGDIYHSDLATVSLLVKNSTPAGDRLTWSSMGNFLAWRPKTLTATPSAVTVYNRNKKTLYTIKPFSGSTGEVVDFAFSPDETQLALLLHDTSYKIAFYSSYYSTASANVYSRAIPVKQMFWSGNQTIIFSGDDGISGFDTENLSENLLIKNAKILRIKLSPDGKKLLYSTGDENKSELYLYDIESRTNQIINPNPEIVDMGTTGLNQSELAHGFIPYAVFMPDGNGLIVGYRYLPNLPIVGIYNLKDQKFTAIAAFMLYDSDIMIDSLRLLGTRVNTQGYIASKQISLFTLEDNSKLGLIRIITDASSPIFFGKDILPSGNNF